MKRIAYLVMFCLMGFGALAQQVTKYKVQKSDETLWDIALKHYKINGYIDIMPYARNIAEWNGLNIDSYSLYPGQELWMVDPCSIPEESPEPPLSVIVPEEGDADSIKGATTLGLEPSKGDIIPVEEPPVVNTSPLSYSWIWLLIGLIIGFVIGIILYYQLFVKKHEAEHKRNEDELSRSNSSLSKEKLKVSNELSGLRLELKTLKRNYNELVEENNSFRKEIEQLKDTSTRLIETRTIETAFVHKNQDSPTKPEPSSTLYADSIIDDYFVKVRETPTEDSIFVLFLNGENSAEFSIYDTAQSKVIANPSYLDGCEKQVLCETNQIEIISKGKAQREGDGKWRVINKLNVIIR